MKGIKDTIVKGITAAAMFAVFCLGVPGISLVTVWADGSTKTTGGTTALWSGEKTLTGDDVIIDNGVSLLDDTTLNIAKDMTLTVNKGINCDGNTLTIIGPGTVIVTGKQDGGDGGNGITGNVTMNGGTMTVNGGSGVISGSALKGCGGIGIYGNVTMNGGTLTVNGGQGNASNDSGDGIEGTVIMNGGKLTANGAFGDSKETLI